jgi:hypothetical protein
VQYSVQNFNPFDLLNRQTQEKKIKKLYIERDNIKDSSLDLSLTLGASEDDYSTGLSGDGDQIEANQSRSAKKGKGKR